jgi:hypothetical protein
VLNISSGFQPRKLARHLCTFFALIESNRVIFPPPEVVSPFENVLSYVLYFLGFLDETVIGKLVSENDIESAKRIAICLVEINSIWRGDDVTSDEIENDDEEEEEQVELISAGEDELEETIAITSLLPTLYSMRGDHISSYTLLHWYIYKTFLLCFVK